MMQCLGWQLFGDKYWCVSVGLVYKSMCKIPPARMTVVSRKETHFVDISIVNLIVGWR